MTKETRLPWLMKSPRRIGYKTGSTPSISWITSVLPNRTASSRAVEKLESWQGKKGQIIKNTEKGKCLNWGRILLNWENNNNKTKPGHLYNLWKHQTSFDDSAQQALEGINALSTEIIVRTYLMHKKTSWSLTLKRKYTTYSLLHCNVLCKMCLDIES